MPKILGINGSLRRTGSRTLHALEIALRGAADAGAHTELLDLKQLDLPFYDDRPDVQSYPPSVFTLVERVRWADGLILASPVYHGTLSGAMKNALDFLELLSNDQPPWLENKVVGLISVAGGNSGINTINSMLHTCRAMRAWVLPLAVTVPGSAFTPDGQLHDLNITERLLKLGVETARYAQLFAQERRL
ncbi:MAG: NAD(P)H-dependent oxidoreductase [Candidatus Bipolaricaulota bacterium]|nr:NAD(P)H-dependent oxidoreductase [Candidatus Bipolaricaulota bacterium]MCS7274386.1 NAD(P)H-dependent oxidoreductase [Candidatus Bipolaricaulota bacterium]MDW8110504.1 NAD(P)H-dependent oxidoreductase [Candidatus Bipolaricaulota bacterium]MDW8329962.1 NAD(P)H-dependent oxidoreductase [Candidatus Bipolaricaulota bacterium]